MAEGLIEFVQQLTNGNPSLSLDHVEDTYTDWTVWEVPAHLRTKYPANFQNKGLEFGLHRRTLTKSPPKAFKADIARILHSKLTLKGSSWDRFARDLVGDVNKARRAYSSSSARFSDADIYSLLALDALFLVFLFKYAFCGDFFLKEFETLAGKLREILFLTDETDFLLIDNQVPMHLLQSAIRQLCVIDKDTFQKRIDDPGFQLELKVEDELEVVLIGAVVPLEKSLINCQHLLDCLYTVICGHSLPFSVEEGTESSRLALESTPSATRLEAVGIRSITSVCVS